MNKRSYILLVGILLAHLLLLMSFKFTAWPEMSLWPYLMTKGWLPYSNIAIVHTPLLLIDLSIFYAIFGSGILQLKIFTWILILLSDILIFFAVKNLWNKKVAFASLVAYALWLLFYDGNGLWFDLYMGVFVFCSFYFARSKKWLFGGIFWGLAFISKQTAIWFLLPILFELIGEYKLKVRDLNKFKIKDLVKGLGKFILGASAVGTVFTLLLLAFKLLPSFWNWAVNFGVFTLPVSQGQIQLPSIKTLLVALLPFIIFIPLILSNWKNNLRNLVLLTWAIAGFMGSYPRFEYFHFQPALFYLAVATALILTEKKNLLTKIFIPVYLFGSIYLMFTYFVKNFNEGTRFFENDVSEVTDFVKYNTQKGDRIFVLNYWDNIYSLTDTVPATNPWIPQLSWYTEAPNIQDTMVEGLVNNPPKIIVFKPYTNYGLSSYIPTKVYQYVTDNYQLNSKIDGVEMLIHK